MSRLTKYAIGQEFARRKCMFHRSTPWEHITLFGLFAWGDVSPWIKKGELSADGYRRENKIVWVKPTPAFYEKYVVPQLQEEERKAIAEGYIRPRSEGEVFP